MINTTTYAIKQLFYSLGGNAEDVAGINDDLTIIAKI